MRAIEDDRLPNSVLTGVTKALLQEGEPVDHMLDELVASLGLRAERMHRFAKNGNYAFGLPSGQFTSPGTRAQDAVEAVLKSLHGGADVEVDYLCYGMANNLHIGWLRLMDAHGYSPATNQLGNLTAAKGTPVYLDDMLVVVPASQLGQIEPETIKQWGFAARAGYTPERTTLTDEARALITPSEIETDAGTTEYLRVKYVWTANGVLQRDSFTIPVAGYADEADYFQARYRVGGVVKYWIYQDGQGTYPTLDSIYDASPEPGGSFFPFVYFRHDKRSVITDKSTREYKTSKQITKILGMDYDQIAEGIDANPDIADVEQAVMMFAVPANTTVEIERRYLWEFFNSLFMSQTPEERYKSEDAAKAGMWGKMFMTLTGTTPGMVIQDSRFKMTLRNSGIFKRKIAGAVAAVGRHSSGYDAPGDYHYYRRQITANVYEEIQVKNMETVFRIFGNWSVTGDDDDKILLVPLDHSITKHYTIPEREELYSRSLHYVFNSRIVTKLKWYERGIFKVIMIVVAIAMAIYTWGATGALIGAAVGAGAYASAAYLILGMLIEYLVITLVFRLFVKIVGVRLAFVIAIIAAIAGVTQVIQTGSLAGAPFAADLLMMSTNLTTAIGSQMQNDLADLLGEYKEFEFLKKEQEALLDTAKDLLNNTVRLDPFVIFGEKPDDFYNRTVHAGNIGMASIEVVSSFVDMKLTLPTLKETIEYGGA